MAKKTRTGASRRARFATKAKKGWIIPSAEGRRFSGMRALPTPERRQAAIDAVIRTAR